MMKAGAVQGERKTANLDRVLHTRLKWLGLKAKTPLWKLLDEAVRLFLRERQAEATAGRCDAVGQMRKNKIARASVTLTANLHRKLRIAGALSGERTQVLLDEAVRLLLAKRGGGK